MFNTLTYTVRVETTPDQSKTLSDTCSAYLDCCNMVSKTVWEHRTLSQKTLNQLVYHRLRDEYHVGAQMAQSSIKAGHSVIVVDPRYTSQTCPKCGTVRKANRDKRLHEYHCSNCGYRSNDDRVAAMNIQRLGYQSVVESQSDKL